MVSVLRRLGKNRPPSHARSRHSCARSRANRLLHAARADAGPGRSHPEMVYRRRCRAPRRDGHERDAHRPGSPTMRKAGNAPPGSRTPLFPAGTKFRPMRGTSPVPAASLSPTSRASTWSSRARPAAADSGNTRNSCGGPAKRSSPRQEATAAPDERRAPWDRDHRLHESPRRLEFWRSSPSVTHSGTG